MINNKSDFENQFWGSLNWGNESTWYWFVFWWSHLFNSFRKEFAQIKKPSCTPWWKVVTDHYASWGQETMLARKLNASEKVLGFWQWGLKLNSSQHSWLNISLALCLNFMAATWVFVCLFLWLFLFVCLFFFSIPCNIRDLNSLTRGWTGSPCSGSMEC